MLVNIIMFYRNTVTSLKSEGNCNVSQWRLLLFVGIFTSFIEIIAICKNFTDFIEIFLLVKISEQKNTLIMEKLKVGSYIL